MILNKKIMRNMKLNKSIYLIIALLLVLSNLLFVLLKTDIPATKNGVLDFKRDYLVEDSSFETMAPINNTSELEKKFNLVMEELRYKDFSIAKNKDIRIFSNRKNIDKHMVIKGDDIKGDNEVLLTEAFCKNNDIKIGDKIKAGKKELKIVGFMTMPDYIYPLKNEAATMADMSNFAVAVVNEDTFKEFENFNLKYAIRYNAHKDNEEIDSLKEYIKGNFGILSWTDKEDNSNITTIDSELRAFGILEKFVPVAIMIIVSILIAIVITRQVKLELSQIGTLYALGYKKNKILKHYMTYPIILIALSVIIGTALGLLSLGVVTNALRIEYCVPLIEKKINYSVVFWGVFLPFIIILPINYIMLDRFLKEAPVKLMKGTLKVSKPRYLEQKLSTSKLSFKWRYRLKDLVRTPLKAVVTILTIVFSSLLLFFIFMVNDAMQTMIKDGYERSFKAEHMYFLSNVSTEEVKGEKLWVLPVKSDDTKGEEVKFSLEGREADSKLFNIYDKYDNLLSFKDNIITSTLAERLGVAVGDKVKVTNTTDNSIYEIKIDKIAKSMLGDTIYISLDEFYKITKMPENSYIGVYSNEEIKFKEATIKSEVTREGLIDGIRKLSKPLMSIMYFIAIIAAGIGVALIYVVISLVVEEKKNDISLLKIMGYENKKLYGLVLNTNNILVLLGYLISIPVSSLYFGNLFREISKGMEFSLEGNLTLSTMVIVGIIILVSYLISINLAKLKVMKISMDEALKKGRE